MADYEIIQPKVDLRKKIKVMPAGSDFDPIAKAEQALERLSVNFNIWMGEEVGKIQTAWNTLEKQGMTEETLETLFRSGHDIKGQAHTMGFPIAGTIAGSLCNLIENVPDRTHLPQDILHKHVQAICAVVKEDAREEDNVIGKALAHELVHVANEIVEKYGIVPE